MLLSDDRDPQWPRSRRSLGRLFGAFNIGLRRLGTFAAVESWNPGGYFVASDPSGLVTLDLGLRAREQTCPRPACPASRQESGGPVFESGRPIAHVAADLGVHPEALRKRVRRAEADAGGRRELLSSGEREELAGLRREVKQLRKANEILRAASVFFAGELDPTRSK
jgi:transposase